VSPKGVILPIKPFFSIGKIPPIIIYPVKIFGLSILPSWLIFERAVEYMALPKDAFIYSDLNLLVMIYKIPHNGCYCSRLWEVLFFTNILLEKYSKKVIVITF